MKNTFSTTAQTLEAAEAALAAAEREFLAYRGRHENRLREILFDGAFDALLMEFYEDPVNVALQEEVTRLRMENSKIAV